MVKNFSQMKKAFINKKKFMIVEHFYHPECNGQIRVPNVVQTNAVFSVVDGDPENKVSLANNGKGYYLAYGKASDWTFNADGTIECECMKIKFIEEGD